MQSKNLFFLVAFGTIITLALGAKLLNRNSVFSAENFVKKEGEKIDDLLEKQKLANRAANEIKRKKGFVKPEIIPNNSTHTNDQPEEVYNSNYICLDGLYFDSYLGKCVELKGNNTETMYSNHPTKTKSRIDLTSNTTLAPCLNKTTDKYDDKVVDLTVDPGKK